LPKKNNVTSQHEKERPKKSRPQEMIKKEYRLGRMCSKEIKGLQSECAIVRAQFKEGRKK